MQVSEAKADDTLQTRISKLGNITESFTTQPICPADFRHAIGSDSQVGHHISGQPTVPTQTLAQASTNLG